MSKVKMNVERKHLEFLRWLCGEIKGQDNRGTRPPYYYVIQDYEHVLSVNGTAHYLNEDSELAGDIDECVDFLMEDGEEFENRECAANFVLANYTEVNLEEKLVVVPGPIFLTEKAALRHIKLNAHHYTDRVTTYVDYAWRCPEIEKLFKAIGSIADVDFKI